MCSYLVAIEIKPASENYCKQSNIYEKFSELHRLGQQNFLKLRV